MYALRWWKIRSFCIPIMYEWLVSVYPWQTNFFKGIRINPKIGIRVYGVYPRIPSNTPLSVSTFFLIAQTYTEISILIVHLFENISTLVSIVISISTGNPCYTNPRPISIRLKYCWCLNGMSIFTIVFWNYWEMWFSVFASLSYGYLLFCGNITFQYTLQYSSNMISLYVSIGLIVIRNIKIPTHFSLSLKILDRNVKMDVKIFRQHLKTDELEWYHWMIIVLYITIEMMMQKNDN
jgi:hypothetical protein